VKDYGGEKVAVLVVDPWTIIKILVLRKELKKKPPDLSKTL